jgi:lipoprotein-anchoring transpeptidase ErfK/SrfK
MRQATATGRRRSVVTVAALGTVAALAVGCSGGGGGGSAGGGGGASGPGSGGGGGAAAAKVVIVPAANAVNVTPRTPVVVSVSGGTLTQVSVADVAGHRVAGALSADAAKWTSTGQLAFGATYTVSAHARSTGGAATDAQSKFSTVSARNLAYDAMAPLAGSTMGVGMPVRIYFHRDGDDSSLAVTNRAEVMKHITVRTEPAQQVGYIWFGGGTEVHIRPQAYWQPHTTVTVSLDLLGVELADGVFGKRSREVSFSIGTRHYSVADTRTHRLLVYDGQRLVKNFPASMGKEVPGRFTHNGVHVVIEKKQVQHMDSTTFGLALDAGGYTADVKWATRISNNGEFVHAAPWSVAQQGSANVSHGCVNLSPANAQWFYTFSRPGDVVEVTGSKVPLTPKDGDIYDWTVPWSQWTSMG